MGKEENNKQEQNIDIDIGGDVSGDIHVDRHDTHVDQSVKGVTAKGDAVIATGSAKITLIKVIPSWVWIVVLVTIFGGAAGFWGYRSVKIQQMKESLKFEQGKLGILVANFKPVTESEKEKIKGNRFVEAIVFGLRNYKEEIGERNVDVRLIPPEVKRYLNEQEVEDFAKEYGAKLVVWGEISMEGEEGKINSTVQPVKYEKERHDLSSVLEDVDVVQFETSAESLKEDMQRLISFILGYMYYMQPEKPGDLERRVVKYFNNALGFKKKQNNAYTHFYLGNAYSFSGNIQKAEEEYKEILTELGEDFYEFPNFTLKMEVYNNLGLLALNRYQIEEAQDYFRKADNEYGQCSEQIDRWQESTLSPGCVSLLYNLANVSLEKDEYRMAIEYAEKAVKALELFQERFTTSFVVLLYNTTAYTYIEQARAEQDFGYHEKAKAYLAKVANIFEQVSSENLDAGKGAWNRNWGRIYLGAKDWKSALSHFEKSKTLEPKDPIVHLLLAQLYNERCQQGDQDHYFKEKEDYMKKMLRKGKFLEAKDKTNKLRLTCEQ